MVDARVSHAAQALPPLLWQLIRAAPLALAISPVGCQFVSRSDYDNVQAVNRSLSEQNHAQLVELNDLRTHSKQIEDRLVDAEQQLALSDDRLKADGTRLANYQQERSQLRQAYADLPRNGAVLPSTVASQLAELARRHPSLQFDPQSGVAKLDGDVLFDSGEAALKPQSAQLLADLSDILQSADARGVRILVVGHTDAQKIAGREARQRFGDNWQLSTARAVAVAEYLKKAGVEERRLGVAGYGGQQPIAPNSTATDRRRNRRVEIFLIPADAPVVGWTETSPNLY